MSSAGRTTDAPSHRCPPIPVKDPMTKLSQEVPNVPNLLKQFVKGKEEKSPKKVKRDNFCSPKQQQEHRSSTKYGAGHQRREAVGGKKGSFKEDSSIADPSSLLSEESSSPRTSLPKPPYQFNPRFSGPLELSPSKFGQTTSKSGSGWSSRRPIFAVDSFDNPRIHNDCDIFSSSLRPNVPSNRSTNSESILPFSSSISSSDTLFSPVDECSKTRLPPSKQIKVPPGSSFQKQEIPSTKFYSPAVTILPAQCTSKSTVEVVGSDSDSDVNGPSLSEDRLRKVFYSTTVDSNLFSSSKAVKVVSEDIDPDFDLPLSTRPKNRSRRAPGRKSDRLSSKGPGGCKDLEELALFDQPFSFDTLSRRDYSELFYFPFPRVPEECGYKSSFCTGDCHRILLRQEELDRTEPGQYFNDVLIDFYYKYLELHLNSAQDFYFFSSYFYKVLSSKREVSPFSRLKKWTQKVDLFSKLCLFIPVNESLHWYLIVVANPGLLVASSSASKSGVKCGIFVLDSLGIRHRNHAVSNIKKYLYQELVDKKGGVLQNDLMDMTSFLDSFIVKYPTLPLQRNSTDCGVYLLEYTERLVCRAASVDMQFFLEMAEVPWFQHSDVVEKRHYIREILLKLTEEYQKILKLLGTLSVAFDGPSEFNRCDGGSSSPIEIFDSHPDIL